MQFAKTALDDEAAAPAGRRVAQGTAGAAGLSQIELAQILGLKVLHVHFPGGERLRPGSDREHGSLGARAPARPVGVRAQAPVLLRAGTLPAAVRGEEMTRLSSFRGPLRSAADRAGRAPSSSRSSRPAPARLRPAKPAAGRSGTTEHGDPQVYLIGPPPDYDCILSISRLGRLYVIEDGTRPRAVRARQPDAVGRAGDCGAAPAQGCAAGEGRGGLGRVPRGLRGEDRGADWPSRWKC